MTWIKIIPYSESEGRLREAYEAQRPNYPPEYFQTVERAERYEQGASIVASHSLFPEALYHTFSAYASLLAPDTPLSRSQQEMIATTVSAINSCFY